jgi:Putative lumazine-binding
MLRPVAIRPLLPVLVACLLVGCGDDGPSAEEQIRSTLGEFQRATAERDYGALCDRILAPALIESVERIGLPCKDALAKGFEDVRDPRLSVGTITVNGDTATAQVRSSAAGQQPSEDSVSLIRTDAGWRIASLAGGNS